jgi:hypothetical protein
LSSRICVARRPLDSASRCVVKTFTLTSCDDRNPRDRPRVAQFVRIGAIDRKRGEKEIALTGAAVALRELVPPRPSCPRSQQRCEPRRLILVAPAGVFLHLVQGHDVRPRPRDPGRDALDVVIAISAHAVLDVPGEHLHLARSPGRRGWIGLRFRFIRSGRCRLLQRSRRWSAKGDRLYVTDELARIIEMPRRPYATVRRRRPDGAHTGEPVVNGRVRSTADATRFLVPIAPTGEFTPGRLLVVQNWRPEAR